MRCEEPLREEMRRTFFKKQQKKKYIMEISTAKTIATALSIVSSPSSRSIVASGLNYIVTKRFKSKVISVTLPIGKTTLCERFNAMFAQEGAFYALDVEKATMDSLTEPDRIALDELKKVDLIRYSAQFIPLCKSYFDSFIESTIKFNSDTVFIVVTSSRKLKKFLGLANAIYIQPERHFVIDTLIKTLAPHVITFINYTKSEIRDKDPYIFRSWDDLFDVFLNAVGVSRGM